MKLQNKILLMLIIAFSFILFFNISNVKAYTYEVSEDGTSFTIPYTYNDNTFNSPPIPIEYLGNDYIVWHKSTSDSEREFVICTNSSDGKFYINDSLSYITYSGNSMKYYNIPNKKYWSNCGGVEMSSGRKVVSASMDVVKSDGTVFFQVPVVEEEPTQEITGVIAPLLDQQKMEETTLQIRVIIPLIIVVVVSFLGLRKALKMLSQILHRS